MDAYSTLMLARERMAELEREARRERLARLARHDAVDQRRMVPEFVSDPIQGSRAPRVRYQANPTQASGTLDPRHG